jgi:hypothetical protein
MVIVACAHDVPPQRLGLLWTAVARWAMAAVALRLWQRAYSAFAHAAGATDGRP